MISTGNGVLPVSVVMSVYNGGRFLPEAAESILVQTHSAFEFIIVDDGSTDGSTEWLAALAAREPRVRLIRQENQGLTKSLNRGLSIARGKYVARMDADDVSSPDRLARQLSALEADLGAVLVTSALDVIDEDGALIRRIETEPEHELAGWRLLFENFIRGHGQVMFRRDVALDVGGYDESLPTAQDYDLWCRLWRRGTFLFLPDVLYRYRLRQGSVTRTRLDEQTDSCIESSRRHLRKWLGVSIEMDQMRKLWAFWSERRTNVAMSNLDARDVDSLDDVLDRIHASYLRTDEGRRLSTSTRTAIRRSIAHRYLRWAGRSIALRSTPDGILSLVWKAFRWSPSACFRAAPSFVLRTYRSRLRNPSTA